MYDKFEQYHTKLKTACSLCHRTTTSRNFPSLENTRHHPSSAQTNGNHTASLPSPPLNKAAMHIVSCGSFASYTSCHGKRQTQSGNMRRSSNE
jgi:hypothetical protein